MLIGGHTCNRHLSGVSHVRLYDVRDVASVELDSSGECFTSVGVVEGALPIDIPLAERSASYQERLTLEGGVEHRLEFAVRGCRPEVVEQLRALSSRGMIAEVATPNGVRLLVGYSKRASCDYPLRVATSSAETFRVGERMPETLVTLISRDGWSSREIIQE